MRRSLLFPMLAAIGPLCAVTPARADAASDSAAAQALFDRARSLMASGRAAEACPKLEESQRLDPGSGTLINLARCYEQTQRLASAWSKYLEAAAAAKAADNADRENEARQQAARLRPRLSNLVIVLPARIAALRGIEVTRDGEPVGAPQWGLPIPIDAGDHTVIVKAPGYLPWQTVASARREGGTTTVDVPGLVPAPEPALLTEPAQRSSAAAAPHAARGGTQRALSVVAGVVGVAGLGVAVGFGVKSKQDHDRAAKYCSGSLCDDPRGVSASRDARSAGNVATVASIVGGVGVVSALTLWLTAPSSSESATQLGLGPGTLQLRRTF